MNKECLRPGQGGVVAFLHIPKTAGTTLNAILASQYSPDQTREIMMRGMSWLVPRPTLVPKPLISFSKIWRLRSTLRYGRSVRMIHGHFDLSIKEVLPSDEEKLGMMQEVASLMNINGGKAPEQPEQFWYQVGLLHQMAAHSYWTTSTARRSV